MRPTSAKVPAVAGLVSTAKQREEAWEFCTTALERHYEERLKRWNAELDMLLVFAGLFSTALTAFIVQSYPLLQPDDTDTVMLALAHISSQLNSFTVNPNFINSTQHDTFTTATTDAPFKTPIHAIWINLLWFSSLICTLSASSVAVLVKQWLHQYSQGLSGSLPEAARLRQYRYDSLLKWHVPEIIAALPMLLQLGFTLFLGGLLVLLWHLNPSVAVAASILVGLLAMFAFATTFLPIFYSDCCYQSPQALSLFLLIQGVVHFFSKALRVVERRAQESAQRAGSWTSRKYVVLTRLRGAARLLLKRLGPWGTFRNWQTREKPDVEAKHPELEQSIVLTAYYITLDNTMFNTTIIPCLSSMESLSARMSIHYGNLLRDVTDRLPDRDWRVWRPLMPFILMVLSLITREPTKGMVRKVLLAMPRYSQSSAKSKLGMLYLFAMSQLITRRIAPREAFYRLLLYLQDSRIDVENSPVPGTAILDDVEAVFPAESAEVEERINLDQYDSVGCYITGLEYMIKYLLRHRVRLEQDGSSVPDRVLALLVGFKVFLSSNAWRTSRSRQEVFLLALRYSQLPDLFLRVKQELIPDDREAHLRFLEVVETFRESLSTIEEGYIALGNNVGQSASQGMKQVLDLVRTTLDNLTKPSQPSGKPSRYVDSLDGRVLRDDSPTDQAISALATQLAGSDDEARPVGDTAPHLPESSSSASKVSPPGIVISSTGTGTTCQNETDTVNPWIELLDILDIDYSFDSSGVVPRTPTTAYGGEDVADTPLPDPDIWQRSLQHVTADITRRDSDVLGRPSMHSYKLNSILPSVQTSPEQSPRSVHMPLDEIVSSADQNGKDSATTSRSRSPSVAECRS